MSTSTRPSPRRRCAALVAAAAALVAGVAIVAAPGGRAIAPPGRDAPAADPAPPRAPRPPPPLRPAAIDARPVDNELVRAEVAAFAAGYVGAIAAGDREAIRAHLDGGALFDAAADADELRRIPLHGIDYVPLARTDDAIRDLEDSILDVLLAAPEDERADWAARAELRDLLELPDGRLFVRLYAEGVRRQVPSGRDTGIDPGRRYGPDDRVELEQDWRFVVARRGGRWAIVEFPRADRHPAI